MSLVDQQYFSIARKIVSNMTSESWESIPHVCITYEPEVTAFLNVLADINTTKTHGGRITLNTAMLRVIVEGLKACPKMNSHIRFNRRLVRGHIDTFDNIDISMPVMLETGEMMTINMHGFENKSLSQMRDAIKNSMERAHNSDLNEVMFEVSMDNTLQGLKKGKIMQAVFRLIGSKTGSHKVKTLSGAERKAYYSKPESERLTKHDIEQGTITVSNLGSVYREWDGECTILEIIPPQITAIGIGAVKNVPICDHDGNICPGKKLPLTIAFDHRALDMGDIAPFLKRLDEIFKKPEVMEEWV